MVAPDAELVEGARPGVGEVLLDASVVRELGFSAGDPIRLLPDVEATEHGEVEISGLVEDPSVPSPGANDVLYGEVSTLNEAIERDSDQYSQLLIEDSDPEAPAAELDALAEGPRAGLRRGDGRGVRLDPGPTLPSGCFAGGHGDSGDLGAGVRGAVVGDPVGVHRAHRAGPAGVLAAPVPGGPRGGRSSGPC